MAHPPTALGIDLGTSAIKLVLVDAAGRQVGAYTRAVPTFRPEPGASEQDPEDWWVRLELGMAALSTDHAEAVSAVASIGLSGQMHGLVCLDAQDRPVRCAILWNDGRARKQAEWAATLPGLATRAGLRPAPGLTACKAAWLARVEPEDWARVRRITLCKDYLRLRMIGKHATDPCDAAGTLLFDEHARDWSDDSLSAFGLSRSMMPIVIEGPEVTGALRPEIARRWGIAGRPTVIAGAGDGAAGALGIGVGRPGEGFISLGTSAQISIAQDHYTPAPQSTAQILAHGLPDLWYRAAALQSGTSSISWAASMTGCSVAQFIALASEVDDIGLLPVFLPYLAGERTPHDNPGAQGVLFGLLDGHTNAHVAQSVLRGVAFALADGHDELARIGQMPERLYLVGGGARSPLLNRIIASVLGKTLSVLPGSSSAAALGVARMAMAAHLDGPVQALLQIDAAEERDIAPDPELRERLLPELERFRTVYKHVEPLFGC